MGGKQSAQHASDAARQKANKKEPGCDHGLTRKREAVIIEPDNTCKHGKRQQAKGAAHKKHVGQKAVRLGGVPSHLSGKEGAKTKVRKDDEVADKHYGKGV